MSLASRDAGEIEALVTDRYLDALLSGGPAGGRQDPGRAGPALEAAIRVASQRLATDLPRFHPSFRFEERLAVRLAEAAAAMRLPRPAGDEHEVVRLPSAPADLDPLAFGPEDEDRDAAADEPGLADALARPAVLRGAVAASALSLAGAAWYAWRHRPAASPMARAARAARAARRSRATGSGRLMRRT
ncbi:MAG TPA: hypothetical protein VFW20_04700 [Candidatus Limnocylindrales bacterium]|nr:hypothetical protein [Candidatus Limnocylindrales bacterium]